MPFRIQCSPDHLSAVNASLLVLQHFDHIDHLERGTCRLPTLSVDEAIAAVRVSGDDDNFLVDVNRGLDTAYMAAWATRAFTAVGDIRLPGPSDGDLVAHEAFATGASLKEASAVLYTTSAFRSFAS
jgi:hypothetical protein